MSVDLALLDQEISTSKKIEDFKASGRPPFRGIKPFRVEDEAVFSGRSRTTGLLQTKIEIYRCVLLFGKTGTGKSSMISAGLIPALIKRGIRVEVIKFRPDQQPIVVQRLKCTDTGEYYESIFQELLGQNRTEIPVSLTAFSRIILPFGFSELVAEVTDPETLTIHWKATGQFEIDYYEITVHGEDWQTIGVEKRTGESSAEYYVSVALSGINGHKLRITAIDRDANKYFSDIIDLRDAECESISNTESNHQETLIVIDQFEQLFTLFMGNSENLTQQSQLIRRICELMTDAKSNVKFLFAIREDFVAYLESFKEYYPRIFDNRVQLTQLSKEEAQEAILGPFKLGLGPAFSSELIQLVVQDLAIDDFVSPTELQIVCRTLWDKFSDRPDTAAIRVADYESLGGKNGIIDGFLSDQIGAMPINLRECALSILENLVTDSGTRNILAARPLHVLVNKADDIDVTWNDFNTAIEQLVAARLINRISERGTAMHEIASEYLIRPIEKYKIETNFKKEHIRAEKAEQERQIADHERERAENELIEAERIAKRLKLQARALFVTSAALLFCLAALYWLRRDFESLNVDYNRLVGRVNVMQHRLADLDSQSTYYRLVLNQSLNNDKLLKATFAIIYRTDSQKISIAHRFDSLIYAGSALKIKLNKDNSILRISQPKDVLPTGTPPYQFKKYEEEQKKSETFLKNGEQPINPDSVKKFLEFLHGN